MQPNKTWLLLRLLIRGSILIAALAYFVHTQLSGPMVFQPTPRKNTTLLSRLAKKAGLSEAQVRKVLLELGPELSFELQRGNKINLPGLGSLQMVYVPAYQQEDQNIKKTVIIPASHQVEFQPSDHLLKKINQESNQPMARGKQVPPGPGSNSPLPSPIQQAVLRELQAGN